MRAPAGHAPRSPTSQRREPFGSGRRSHDRHRHAQVNDAAVTKDRGQAGAAVKAERAAGAWCGAPADEIDGDVKRGIKRKVVVSGIGRAVLDLTRD
jgi:hypothetical protein